MTLSTMQYYIIYSNWWRLFADEKNERRREKKVSGYDTQTYDKVIFFSFISHDKHRLCGMEYLKYKKNMTLLDNAL